MAGFLPDTFISDFVEVFRCLQSFGIAFLLILQQDPFTGSIDVRAPSALHGKLFAK